LWGLTLFDLFHQYFKENYDELSAIFLEKRKPSELVNKDSKAEVENLHEAYVNEMKNSFS
jgi:hypothetical protein